MRCEQVCHQSLAEADARFGKDTALVVGLSGGMDSCVLLLLLPAENALRLFMPPWREKPLAPSFLMTFLKAFLPEG